jgi:outer membrane receptor protein involved in Fe transport
MNVRGGFSQTVSRPEFRELTPIQFPAPLGGRTLQGNQDLISAHITNWDLRWEWFFSPLELASVSFFYKDLTDPIELVTAVETSNYIYLFVNAESATVWGFEFEGRKDFSFLVPYARRWSWLGDHASKLADLQIQVNVAVIESTVSGFIPPPDSVIAPIPGDRALQGQAPYVVNAALEYQNSEWGIFRLLYNTVGPTIVAAGTDVDPNTPGGINPDITEESRNQLDFVWLVDVNPFDTPVTLKFGVENILNDAYLETQDNIITNNYRTGLTFKVGLSYSY